MKRQNVGSSLIESIGYDPGKHVLEVCFRPNRHGCASIWQYDEVGPDTYAELVAAPSIGVAFQAIKISHKGRKVATRDADGTVRAVPDGFLEESLP